MNSTLTPPPNELLLRPQPKRTHGYITTVSGTKVMCPGMRSSMVRWSDIANSLAMQVRYLGHITFFYSVADHSIYVSLLAQAYGEPPEVVRACFLHDVHETYIGDFPSPFKGAVPGLPLFEKSIEAAVRDAFGLLADDDPIWDRVKHYDIMALHAEGERLFRPIVPQWVDYHILRLVPKTVHLVGREWQEGKAAFLKRGAELGIFQAKP